MAFNENIKAHRTRLNLSQEKLASLLGVTTRMVSQYETGNSWPSSELLPKFAKVFNTSIDALMSEQDAFIMQAYAENGLQGAREAKELVNSVVGLFAGGKLSEDDRDAAMMAISEAYWIAKKEAKEKYSPKARRGL